MNSETPDKTSAPDDTVPRTNAHDPETPTNSPLEANSIRNSKKRKHKRRKKSTIEIPAAGFPLLCFDTETTNHGEMLEMSVFDIDGNEIYHQYFRPGANCWPTEIHHITPEMVSDCKRFARYRHDIQELLNGARFFVGCALSNDLHTLRRYGVRINPDIKVMDIQNWYWLLHDNSNRLEHKQTGLAAIAEKYGLQFGDEQAHSATADARLTLECFKALVKEFASTSKENSQASIDDLQTLEKLFSKEYQDAMQQYRMMNSKGWLHLMERPQGVSFKFTRFELTDNPAVLLSVEVNDRLKAQEDMSRHFADKQAKGYTGIYKLDPEDLDFIRRYQNSIDIDTFREREQRLMIEKQKAREINRLKNPNTFRAATSSAGSSGNATYPAHHQSDPSALDGETPRLENTIEKNLKKTLKKDKSKTKNTSRKKPGVKKTTKEDKTIKRAATKALKKKM